MASRQQQLQGGGGFGSLFGSAGVTSVQIPSPVAAAHLAQGQQRSPTQIQDPASLNGQRIASGSYVYTNAAAAAAAALSSSSGQSPYTSTNGYHPTGSNGSSTPSSEYMTPVSSTGASSYNNSYSYGNGVLPPPLSHPPSSPGLVSQHSSSKSSSGGSSSRQSSSSTFNPEKLKRAQSTPKISSLSKTFGSSGGKSFMSSIRGGSSSWEKKGTKKTHVFRPLDYWNGELDPLTFSNLELHPSGKKRYISK